MMVGKNGCGLMTFMYSYLRIVKAAAVIECE